jgi:hypothetical protein
VLAVLVCSKKLLGNTMDNGNMQEKEQRSPWLAIRFGCCASKEDVVDNGRETLRATGMYYFTCFQSHSRSCTFLSFTPLPLHSGHSSFGLRRLTILLRCTTHLACTPLNLVNKRLYPANIPQHPSNMLEPTRSIEHQTNAL